MIVENNSVKSSILQLDKKHIFVVILALKQLCVHPMLLLKGVYSKEMAEKNPDEVEPQDADATSIEDREGEIDPLRNTYFLDTSSE